MSILYRLDADAQQIGQRFHADAGRDPWTGGDVAPSSYAPVIVRTPDRMRRIVPRQWGVPPPPKQLLLGGAPVLTVRNLESPFWIGTLRHTQFRCLVPATAFGLSVTVAGQRSQSWFTLPASPLFAFAGIWRDSEVPSYAILTCEPNRLVGASGTQAMPVLLHAEDHDSWLGADWKQARKLVAPFPSQLMAMHATVAPRA